MEEIILCAMCKGYGYKKKTNGKEKCWVCHGTGRLVKISIAEPVIDFFHTDPICEDVHDRPRDSD